MGKQYWFYQINMLWNFTEGKTLIIHYKVNVF